MKNWHTTAIEQSQIITDAWSVVKAYAGRAAEPILFFCMLGNIAQILPGVSLPLACSNLILGIQAVTLDVAGLALSTLAEQAESQGAAQAAKKARRTGYCLIGLMLVTVALVTTALLWPATKIYVDQADKALILARVLATVVYGYIIHGLRKFDAPPVQAATATQAPAVQVDDLKTWLGAQLIEQAQRLERLDETVTTLQTQLTERLNETSNDTPATQPAPYSVQKNDTPGDTESETESAANITYLHTPKRAKTRTRAPVGKAAQAARHIRKNPGITAPVLAQKANISETYARKLLAQARAETAAVNQ